MTRNNKVAYVSHLFPAVQLLPWNFMLYYKIVWIQLLTTIMALRRSVGNTHCINPQPYVCLPAVSTLENTSFLLNHASFCPLALLGTVFLDIKLENSRMVFFTTQFTLLCPLVLYPRSLHLYPLSRLLKPS